ncbi:hypothetical protein V1503_19345 [Bacillus sp. SCS-151]|uniref:hypothetical protein n=1 Tax=Nanhaiella sioensis TaxID=3115293 RepID=UPI0039784D08
MENTEFNPLHEQINNSVNTNALIIMLNRKGLITAREFNNAKNEAITQFKNEFPELFYSKKVEKGN